MTELDQAREEVRQGRITQALDRLNRHVFQTKSLEAELLKAVCLARLGETDSARKGLVEVLETHPDCYEAFLSLAEIAHSENSYPQAAEWARAATLLHPLRHEAFGILGLACLKNGEPVQAVEALARAIELAPSTARYHLNLGRAYSAQQRHLLAAMHFEEAIKIAPGNEHAYPLLASAYLRLDMAEKALETLCPALKSFPKNGELQTLMASTYTLLHNEQAAELHHHRSAELSSEGAVAFATWLSEQGRFAEASDRYQDLIRNRPRMGIAYYGLFQCQGIQASENLPLIGKMEQLAKELDVHPLGRMYLCFALGKAFEQLNDFKVSMAYYDAANELAYQNLAFTTSRFSRERKEAETQRALNCFGSMESMNIWGSSGASPFFIIGSPRSGTTLLDQVVTNHSTVRGAGELRFWIEKGGEFASKGAFISGELLTQAASEYVDFVGRILGGSDRWTDKMPGNFLYAGLIYHALPNARFLHIQRSPIDTALSLYTTFLGVGGSMPYRKVDIVTYYKSYLKVMEFWREALPPERLIEIHYEDLVADPSATVEQVLDFCGLSWEEGCFAPEMNRGAIHTPSSWQARQPIYRTSVDRWRKFEPWLGELAELLPFS